MKPTEPDDPDVLPKQPPQPPDLGPLFEQPPHNRTPTSIAAARAKRDTAATQRMAVLAMIRQYGPVTRDDLQALMHLGPQSLTPRVWELLGNGIGHTRMIKELTGQTRLTRSGRAAVLLQALP
ncbi:MAG TPA: hypothetical protein VM487_12160 [Phycisphaerae bacterium]|nr:hypothetical protein [Phycisphaerae bacterium]